MTLSSFPVSENYNIIKYPNMFTTMVEGSDNF